jgi:hypothetical protein
MQNVSANSVIYKNYAANVTTPSGAAVSVVLTFTNFVFSARVWLHAWNYDNANNVTSLTCQLVGGNGFGNAPSAISKSTPVIVSTGVAVFSSTINSTANTVTFTTNAMPAWYYVKAFVEYIGDGALTLININGTNATFTY